MEQNQRVGPHSKPAVQAQQEVRDEGRHALGVAAAMASKVASNVVVGSCQRPCVQLLAIWPLATISTVEDWGPGMGELDRDFSQG